MRIHNHLNNISVSHLILKKSSFQAVSRLNSVSATASPYPNRSATFLNFLFINYFMASPVIFRRGPSTVSSPMDLKKNRWLLPKPDLLLMAVIVDWTTNSEIEFWTFESKRVLSTLQQCKWTEECPFVIWPRAFSQHLRANVLLK